MTQANPKPKMSLMASGESDDALLTQLQTEAFRFFQYEKEDMPVGLFPDNTRADSPSSIASIGFALGCYPVAAERGLVSRDDAVSTILATLLFFWESEQSDSRTSATGYRGFYYHFLDRKTGKRTWNCELSSIDTTLLIAGALVCARYFQEDTPAEREIRTLTDALYRRIEWDWMCGSEGEATVGMGWKPGPGFLRYRWRGFNEALLLYILALGSPTHPIDPSGFIEATADYRWHDLYGQKYVYAGPLFIHQMPHCYVDFRGIRDAYMRDHDSDYFENSRRATYIQQEYAIRNPRRFAGYGATCWGITASDGPGPARRRIGGKSIAFYDYKARGVPLGPDDGCIAPWAAVTSLPFAPEIVLPTIRHFLEMRVGENNLYGFEATINPTFRTADGSSGGWVSPRNFGLNQGPIVLMIENYRSGLIWTLMRSCPYVVTGLKNAGFTGGWLDEPAPKEIRINHFHAVK